MNAALVIMAAGLGSRYGGNKQVDGVGPNGEVLMEYSIHDAIRAGFTKVVFIVKPEILGLVRTLCGDSLRGKTTRGGKPLEVCYAFQDFESLPAFYTLPAGRTKPFGTTSRYSNQKSKRSPTRNIDSASFAASSSQATKRRSVSPANASPPAPRWMSDAK